MPNEQTSVPLFTAGEVLTAANMNISAGTGVPVFTNTTTRDAAFGGAGEKVLAEGQLCYLSSTNVVQYYDGAAWATVGPASAGALTFIKSQAIVAGAVTFTMSSAFSATYENYLITIANMACSGAGNQMRMTLNGSAGSTYSSAFFLLDYSSSTVSGTVASAVATGVSFGDQTAASTALTIYVQSPFLAKATTINGTQVNTAGTRLFNGIDTNAASSTAFTITMSANTFTSGTFNIYGIATS
jgi:hypothetical protein